MLLVGRTTPKTAPSCGLCGLPSDMWFLGPTLFTLNSILIGSAIFARHIHVTNVQTVRL